VITPYKAQVKLLKSLMRQWIVNLIDEGQNPDDIVEVNTVDAYQGREKEIIIINCVRSNFSQSERGGLGFITDPRRINVAITRAKHFLFVIGNSATLEKNKIWDKFIKEHKMQVDGDGFVKIYNKG
jgi:superfamily I DNA and/or RNA helicase